LEFNGCTEDEALSAAAKLAERLDHHDLSLSDAELRAVPASGGYLMPIAKSEYHLTTASARSRISVIAACGARRLWPARAAMCYLA